MSDDRQGRSGDSGKMLYCSFCGKSQHEVRKLIAGPSVYICDECVELCNDIIREELEEKAASGRDQLPKPHEIMDALEPVRDRPGPRQEGACRWRCTTTTSASNRAASKTRSSWPSPTSC